MPTATPQQFLASSRATPTTTAKPSRCSPSRCPYFGALAAFYVPILGAILLLISSNSGVFGSSRIAYAMSRGAISCPPSSSASTPSYRTPVISIATFCGVAIVELIFAALPSLDPNANAIYARLFRGESGLDFLADLYAFGAATSYSFVFIALIALRLHDPLSPRKFKIPFNIPVRVNGERAEFPIIAVLGFLGIGSILVFTLFTHPIGRIAGPLWLIFGLIFYLFYRRSRKLPMFHSRKQDWRKQQIEILRSAGELELMDEYLANLKTHDERVATEAKA